MPAWSWLDLSSFHSIIVEPLVSIPGAVADLSTFQQLRLLVPLGTT